jgi:hypothetical protein
MRSHPHELTGMVILSGAKDFTPASLITRGKPGDTNLVGEVPHLVREDARLIQRALSLSSCT